MLKLKLTGLSLLAALTITAIASSSALAHEYLVEGKAIAAGEKVEAVGDTGLQWVETKIGGLPIVQECDEGLGTGNLEEKGKSTSRSESKNCRIFEINKGKRTYLSACSLKEPVVIEATGELTGVGEDILTGSGKEETFSEFEIKGESCVIKGKYKVKGTQLCTSPLAELEKVLHEGICTAAGSKLKLGTESVRLYGLKAGSGKLKSGKPSSSN
jgi:hypothetical protein